MTLCSWCKREMRQDLAYAPTKRYDMCGVGWTWKAVRDDDKTYYWEREFWVRRMEWTSKTGEFVRWERAKPGVLMVVENPECMS